MTTPAESTPIFDAVSGGQPAAAGGASGTAEPADPGPVAAPAGQELPAEVVARIAAIEAERDRHAERAARYDAVVSELGFEHADNFDPKRFADEYRAAQDRLRATSVQLAVHTAASKSGANAELLLDSSSFNERAGRLDTSSADFGAQMAALVAEVVEANPVYRSGSAGPAQLVSVPQSGAEIHGGTPEYRITDAELKRMSTADIAKALKDGKLAHLLAA